MLFLIALALTFLRGRIQGSQIGVVWALSVHSLLGKLASPAESFNFYRAAEQCELSQAGFTLEQLVHFGYLDVMYSPAADAKDVMMRLDVTVVARNIVEERYLARLAHFTKLFQNPMDCGQGYVGIPAAYCRANLVRARMVLRSKQGPYDCEPLRCNRDAPFTTPRHELAEPLN